MFVRSHHPAEQQGSAGVTSVRVGVGKAVVKDSKHQMLFRAVLCYKNDIQITPQHLLNQI